MLEYIKYLLTGKSQFVKAARELRSRSTTTKRFVLIPDVHNLSLPAEFTREHEPVIWSPTRLK